MAKKGIYKLPVAISLEKAAVLFQKLAKVNRSIGQLKSEFAHSIVNNSLVSVFALQESVQSTRIEGTQVTFNDMLEDKENRKQSWEKTEVNNYQKALETGAERIKAGYPLSTRLIKELHAILMENARGTTSSGGEFRKIQNFIGPNNKIEDAVYIPIAAHEIEDYMENFDFYINGQAHSSFRKFNKTDGIILEENTDPLLKAAIIHAQFESIHPFLDGNGRLGRILIALVALKEGIVDCPIFLVSEELEKERARYYDLLNGVRGDNPDWYAWLNFFVEACGRMTEKLLNKLSDAENLAVDGLKKCDLESERNIWLYSFSDPYTNAARVAEKLNISPATARKGLNKLAEEGLLYADESVKRNKTYRNYDLLRIIGN